LAELHTSHLGFFSRQRPQSFQPRRAERNLSATRRFRRAVDISGCALRGAASNAGIESGDILLSVDGREISPPEHPVFVMGKQTSLEIVGRDDQRRAVPSRCGLPKGKKLHFVEPKLV